MSTLFYLYLAVAAASSAAAGTPPTPAPSAEAPAAAEAPPALEEPAPTSPQGRARALFEESRQLFAESQFEAAVARLQAAHNLVPSAALLFNIAKCYERMGDYINAIDYYQRYLQSAVGAPDADMVRDLIRYYRQKLETTSTPTTPAERAAVIARRGREYYQAGRYADAISAFDNAHRILAKSAFIYNIAKCNEKLGEYDAAIVYYQRYLAMEPEASDRNDVLAIIQALETRMKRTLSELTVRSAPAGADVFVDDMRTVRGQTPLELQLEPGAHKLVLVKNGYQSVERDFEMPDDRPRDLAYALEKVNNYGGILIDSDVNGAQIFLDGQILALTPYKTIKLVEQGGHQITLRRDGYYQYQAQVQVDKGQLSEVRARLPERGELTGWMTTLGVWVGVASAAVGGLGTVVTYGLGSLTVRGTQLSDNLWLGQQIAMASGLGGVLVGASLIGLDLIIQPSDVQEEVKPSGALPEAAFKDDEALTLGGGQ